MKSFIEKVFTNSIETLTQSKENFEQEEQIQPIEINNTFFNKEYCDKINITKCEEHKNEFEKLLSIKSPVLYWFEFEPSKGLNKKIRTKYITYRNSIKTNFKAANYRNTASYKKDFSQNSKTLYVGKVQTGFWGRIVTHLGYNQSKKTAGMQLFHWYEIEEFGNLKLNYFVFDEKMKYLIPALEKELALELKPLIGRY